MTDKLSQTTHPTVLGLSSDYRTQRWRVVCPKCGHTFSPRTTMLSTQLIDCPKAKCGTVLFANYNAEPPTVTVAKNQEK
jgi:phage terminase large subunit GpA-like protein